MDILNNTLTSNTIFKTAPADSGAIKTAVPMRPSDSLIMGVGKPETIYRFLVDVRSSHGYGTITTTNEGIFEFPAVALRLSDAITLPNPAANFTNYYFQNYVQRHGPDDSSTHGTILMASASIGLDAPEYLQNISERFPGITIIDPYIAHSPRSHPDDTDDIYYRAGKVHRIPETPTSKGAFVVITGSAERIEEARLGLTLHLDNGDVAVYSYPTARPSDDGGEKVTTILTVTISVVMDFCKHLAMCYPDLKIMRHWENDADALAWHRGQSGIVTFDEPMFPKTLPTTGARATSG